MYHCITPFDSIYLNKHEDDDSLDLLYRKLNLLSFGEEAEEEEKELVAVNARIKSSHDVLDDPRLLKEGTENELVMLLKCQQVTAIGCISHDY